MSITNNGVTAMNMPSSIYNVIVGGVLLAIMAFMNIEEILSAKHVEKQGALARIMEVEEKRRKIS